MLEASAAAEVPIAQVALLGTTAAGGPGGRTFAEHAGALQARLTSAEGMFGMRFDPAAVSVVDVRAPTLGDSSAAVGGWFAGRPPTDVLVTCGSGAFALSMGAVCAALAAGCPVRILPIDAPWRTYSLDRTCDAEARLVPWLIRHRFWDALAEADPANRIIWELLAARQAGDTGFAATVRERSSPAERHGLTDGQLGKFTEKWPTAQAALFERIGRGEAADYGLLRAWFTQSLRSLFRKEQDRLPRHARDQIGRLIDLLGDRADGEGGAAGHIRVVARASWSDTTSGCAAMIKDDALTRLYTAASTHRAHLRPERLASGPLPPTLLQAADRWEAKDDQGVRLVSSTGHTGWPVLGSGDVLGLLVVGLEHDGREAEDRLALRTVLTELRGRREMLPRRGVVRLRLLASVETQERAHALARWAATESGADVRVIAPVPADFTGARDAILAELAAEAAPTGKLGSGSLRDVDEIMIVLNPGPPLTNYGMIAAGVEWSLTAACPLWVAELVRKAGVPSELRGGQRVLARLGADRMLAHLAVNAVKRLDMRTARRLAGRGSETLRTVLPALAELEQDLLGAAPDPWTPAERRSAASRRLTLLAQVVSERRHHVPVAYIALEALRPALFPWTVWKEMCAAQPALRQLAKLANESLQGHALDRQDRIRRPSSPTATDVRETLVRAAREFGGLDGALVSAHKTVINRLEGIYRQSA
ncbi:hypothetical protein [Nonomuraea cavernae]|uniref:hypothetical protein n=1 Tax=Nonomuraea cavernae TaxID=2045107 RepID=UPI00166D3FE8|nr:hypothetical protein [Nonomuraea cavernae]MCA2186463.1 hypothetical protein [Nonomuraea cavernae]